MENKKQFVSGVSIRTQTTKYGEILKIGINLENFNYSPHELLAERDLEREKMIRLDTLNSLLKSKWNDMDKSEKHTP